MAKRPTKSTRRQRIPEHQLDSETFPRVDPELDRLKQGMEGIADVVTQHPLIVKAQERQERNTAALEKLADAAARFASTFAHVASALQAEPKFAEAVDAAAAAAESALDSNRREQVAVDQAEDLKARIAAAHENARLARRAGDAEEERHHLETAVELEAQLK